MWLFLINTLIVTAGTEPGEGGANTCFLLEVTWVIFHLQKASPIATVNSKQVDVSALGSCKINPLKLILSTTEYIISQVFVRRLGNSLAGFAWVCFYSRIWLEDSAELKCPRFMCLLLVLVVGLGCPGGFSSSSSLS